MEVETVTLFLALLAGLAAVTAIATATSAAIGDPIGFVAAIRPVGVELAAAVAVTATAGSLYLSEGAGFEPCRLCWVQRGFMYPAALVLVGAILSRGLRPYLLLAAGALAAVGLPIALFHRYEQAVGSRDVLRSVEPVLAQVGRALRVRDDSDHGRCRVRVDPRAGYDRGHRRSSSRTGA